MTREKRGVKGFERTNKSSSYKTKLQLTTAYHRRNQRMFDNEWSFNRDFALAGVLN